MTTMSTKQEVFTNTLQKYLKATKEEKGSILTGLAVSLGMHRKRIIARLKELQMRKVNVNWSDHRGRTLYYTPDVTAALKEVWEVGGKICAERLDVKDIVRNMQKFNHWTHDDLATGKLFAMSVGTMKKRIAKFERVISGGGRCMTKPSSLKELIPIRRGPWKNPDPGVGEIDTVANCGSEAEGFYAFTVQYTDIATLWCLLAAQMGKDKHATLASIKGMRSRLPFPMIGLDPDTGSEFVNWTCKDWCDEEGIDMTRIRPGVSNDHGRIEQKNHVNVRKYAGYIRIDTEERLKILQEMYVHLEIYINHFLPSMKCVKKERTNKKKTTKTYDAATTPYARAMAHEKVSEDVKENLRLFHETLDVIDLKKKIDTLRMKLFKGAKFTKSL
jgi:hypothetical protein